MHRTRLVALIALGAVALAALTWLAAFGPPASVLLWVAAMPMPDQQRNLVAALIAVGVGVLFCVWCLGALRARYQLSARTLVAPIVVAIASASWLADGWVAGAQHQGGRWLSLLVCANITFVFALAGVWRRYQVDPSSVAAIVFRWLVLAWTVTVAFPWLGEMI